jgi:hypothetical protein
LPGAIERVVAGDTNDRSRAEPCPSRVDAAVVFAQVHAVRADRGGEIDIVVDDQRYAKAAARGEQGSGFRMAPLALSGFVAVLQNRGATVQRALDCSVQIRARARR